MAAGVHRSAKSDHVCTLAGWLRVSKRGDCGGVGAGIPIDTDFDFVSNAPLGDGDATEVSRSLKRAIDPVFESLALQVAAEFEVDVALVGERDIEFTNVGIVDNLHISFFGGSVPGEVRDLIESQLTDILENSSNVLSMTVCHLCPYQNLRFLEPRRI